VTHNFIVLFQRAVARVLCT